MATVGYATMQIIPSLRGMERQITGQLSGVDTSKAGRSIGSRLTSAIGTTLKVGAAAVGAAAGTTLGVAFTRGFGRLRALEEADKRLRDMGLSTGNVDKLMKALNDTLTGTPYSLDAGATAMAGFVSAGVKLEKIPSVMRSVADAAAFGQADLGEVADIFQKVALNGRASTEMLNQLQYRSIPATALLADALGKTGEEFREFVSKGELDAETFFSAWEKGAKGFGAENIKMAGAAKGAGETVRGAWGNTMAALDRFGARIIEPVYKRLPAIFGAITGKINDVTAAVGPMIDRFVESERVQSFLDGIATSIESFDLVGWFERVGDRASDMWAKAQPALEAVREFFAGDLFGQIKSDSVDSLGSTFERLSAAAVEAWPAVKQIAASLAEASAVVGVSTWQLLLATLEVVAVLADTVLVPALQKLAGWMEDNQTAVTLLVAAFSGWKVAKLARDVVSFGSKAAGQFSKIRSAASKVGGVVSTAGGKVRDFFRPGGGMDGLRLGFMRAGDAAKSAGSKIAGGVKHVAAWGKAALTSAANTAKDAAAKVLSAAKTAVMAAATKAAAVAQGIFNAVMNANPIMLIVGGLILLGGAVVAAYQKIEPFRNIVDAVGRFFRDTLWPILKQVGEFIGGVFSAYIRLVASHWKVWWEALKSVGGFLADTVWPVVQKVANFIGGVFSTAVKNLAGFWSNTLWPALQKVATFITGTVVPTVQRIISKFVEVAQAVGRSVGEIVGFVTGIPGRISRTVSTMWAGITLGISAAKNWVRDRINDVVAYVKELPGRISSGARGLFDGFKEAFKSALNWIIDRWNGLQFTIPSIEVFGRKIGGNTISVPNIPRFHTGGVVPGRPGEERLALLLAGETVRTREQERQLRRMLASRALTARSTSTVVQVRNEFHGPVAGREGERWVADMTAAAVRKGLMAA